MHYLYCYIKVDEYSHMVYKLPTRLITLKSIDLLLAMSFLILRQHSTKVFLKSKRLS